MAVQFNVGEVEVQSAPKSVLRKIVPGPFRSLPIPEAVVSPIATKYLPELSDTMDFQKMFGASVFVKVAPESADT